MTGNLPGATDSNPSLITVCLEVSWPVSVDYDKREKRLFVREYYNPAFMNGGSVVGPRVWISFESSAFLPSSPDMGDGCLNTNGDSADDARRLKNRKRG